MSTRKHGINVQYLYNKCTNFFHNIAKKERDGGTKFLTFVGRWSAVDLCCWCNFILSSGLGIAQFNLPKYFVSEIALTVKCFETTKHKNEGYSLDRIKMTKPWQQRTLIIEHDLILDSLFRSWEVLIGNILDQNFHFHYNCIAT